jgi:hypothetical protein
MRRRRRRRRRRGRRRRGLFKVQSMEERLFEAKP